VRVGMVCRAGAGVGKISQTPAGRVSILRLWGRCGHKISTRAGL